MFYKMVLHNKVSTVDFKGLIGFNLRIPQHEKSLAEISRIEVSLGNKNSQCLSVQVCGKEWRIQ